MPSSSTSAPIERANHPALGLLLCWESEPGNESWKEDVIFVAASVSAGCLSTRIWTHFGSATWSRSSQSLNMERAMWSSLRPGTDEVRFFMLLTDDTSCNVCLKWGFVMAARKETTSCCCSIVFSLRGLGGVTVNNFKETMKIPWTSENYASEYYLVLHKQHVSSCKNCFPQEVSV